MTKTMKYWVYKGWVGIENYDQEIWNFRLHIEINKCSARLFKKYKINANSIRCSPELFELLKTLEYFDKNLHYLCGRYKIFSSLNVKKNELVIFNTDNFDIKETLKIKNYV
jgi:hypothetical protein